MHILFLTHYFPPETNAPATRTYEHARCWVREHGVNVTVVTNHPNHPSGVLFPGYRNRWLTVENMDRVIVRRVKTFLAPNAGFFRRTLNYGWFMVAGTAGSIGVVKPDVIVATSPQFFCAIAGWLTSCWHRAPFVFEVRDLWPESIVTVGAMRPGPGIRALEKLELFLYRQAEQIVVVTDAFRANLISRGVQDRKIAVIKNGVDLEFFKPRCASPELRRSLGAEDKFVVAYIGTLGMAHALDKVVDVAEAVKAKTDILFLMVGDGAERPRIESLVARKQLTNVRLIPAVGKERVVDYYAVADVGLVTLRDKPLFATVLPSKIFEWMAMARPILCTVKGECRALLSEAGAAVFAEPEDVNGMAAAILQLRKDPGRARQMGEAGREFVEKHFDRNRLAGQYLDLLRVVASRAGK